MKNIILICALIATFISCKKAEVAEPKTSNNAEMKSFPEGKNPGVWEIMIAYDQFLLDYKAAKQSKDQEKLQQLDNTAKKLSMKANEVLAVSEGDDYKQLSEYMKQKTEEYAKISQGE